VTAPEVVRLAARAKVNLSLRVLGPRSDGFHEISTVMQSLEWFDEIEMKRAPKTKVTVEWGSGLSGALPEKPDLVERTIGIIDQTLGGTQAAEVRVVKNIPVAAGLGGGSADAAAAILGMNVLTDHAMSPELMLEVAAQAGSDVPFALVGGTAFARGRGELVERLEHRPLWWVIAVPDFSLETAAVYERWDEMRTSSSRDAQVPTSQAVEEIGRFLTNDLESPAFEMKPSLRGLKDEMMKAGAIGAVMSGSGPAIAGLCRDRHHGEVVADRVNDIFHLVMVGLSSPQGVDVLDQKP
jgi:4-diphosphocytidyl-2-C-methyl-D-erythritol kinase